MTSLIELKIKVVIIERVEKMEAELMPLILLIKQEITILISGLIIIVFKTITTNYNSITHQYCFSCSSNNQTTTNLCKHLTSHCHYFSC